MDPSTPPRAPSCLVVTMLLLAGLGCGMASGAGAEEINAVMETGAQGGSWIDTFDDGSGIDWGAATTSL